MTVEAISTQTVKPNRQDAEEAVRTLLQYFGEDPSREGLVGTPRRFVDAYEEFLAGYNEDPHAILSRTFEEVEGYDDIVLLKNIRIESHCEHHIIPIIGVAHIAYLPSNKVVGISKLARVVDAYSKRLQSQEILTNQIAQAIETALNPRGVAVIIDAKHYCIATRGVHKPEVSCVTRAMTGEFKTDASLESRFYKLVE